VSKGWEKGGVEDGIGVEAKMNLHVAWGMGMNEGCDGYGAGVAPTTRQCQLSYTGRLTVY